MSYIKIIIDETKNDEQLFARYCFKFIECIKNRDVWFLKQLNDESIHYSYFQIILLSALFDLYGKNTDFHKYKDKKFKLKEYWGYEGGYNPTKWDLEADKLKERRIYLL